MTWAIFGAGSQGRVVLDILRARGEGDGAVFVDDSPALRGAQIAGAAVVDRAWLIQHRGDPGLRAVVALGHNPARIRLAGELDAVGVRFANVIHPSAVVMPSARLGVGVMICPGAVIQAGADVGDHALINTCAIVEHDCRIGRGACLSPGVHMGGRVEIGDGAFIGTGATLNPRMRIGAGAIVGAGAVVTREVAASVLAYGVPAREVRPVDPARDWQRLL